jgi:hypothetical protein
MKKIFILILIIFSINSFSQKWEWVAHPKGFITTRADVKMINNIILSGGFNDTIKFDDTILYLKE